MRLLLVEDEATMVRALRRGLSAEGFAVDAVGNGPAGLEAALAGDYDAIALDIMLPGMSGYDVLRSLRAQDVWTPVLMISAKDGEYDIADALDLGADDYLVKPFSFVVLLARLRALIRRGAGERPTVLRVGAIELDPASRRVRRDGADVNLTPREFSLLEYLMRAGGVVGKVELRDHVWDGPGEDLNVVEVYVGYLRRKLGTGSIRTVRGVGYRMAGL